MDNNSINSDLIRGHIDTIILKSLFEGDKYGYEISREIEVKSSGDFVLKQPTLYSALKRLEGQNFISAYWGEITKGARRKYYKLTQNGKDFFAKNQSDWEYSRTIIDNLVSDKIAQVDNRHTVAESIQKDTDAINTVSLNHTGISASAPLAPSSTDIVSTINLDDPSLTGAEKKYDAVIIRNRESADGATDLSHLSQVGKMPEELKQKIADKFNAAKSLAQTRTQSQSDGQKVGKDLPDWIVKNSLNGMSLAAPSNEDKQITPTKHILPPVQHVVDTQPVRTKVTMEQVDSESDKYKNKLIKIFDSQNRAEPTGDLSAKSVAIQPPQSDINTNTTIGRHSFDIRTHTSGKQANDNTYYVYPNKFRVAHFMVLAILIFCELLICHFVFNTLLNLALQTGYFLSAGLLALTLPFVALVFYFHNPEAKKRIRFHPRNQFAKRLVLFCEVLAIITLAMFAADTRLFTSIYNFSKLIIPLIVAGNILIASPISHAMYKLKIFAVSGANQSI